MFFNFRCFIYIYIIIVIGSQPVAQLLRIHTQIAIKGGHTFSPLSFCSIGIQATQACAKCRPRLNVYGSRGLHLPRSTLCWPQQSRLRKMNMGSHECICLQLKGHQGRNYWKFTLPKHKNSQEFLFFASCWSHCILLREVARSLRVWFSSCKR